MVVKEARSISRSDTDWDLYYRKPSPFSVFTRRITAQRLIRNIHQYVPQSAPLTLTELGAGNSCFYETLNRTFSIAAYHLVDNNAFSFEQFKKSFPNTENVHFHLQDITQQTGLVPQQLDLVLSIGLIEHFSPEQLPAVIEAHFTPLKPKGIIILSFPVKTLSYRFCRSLAEITGQWMFHDETPLAMVDVATIGSKFGALLHHENTPIGLTQCMMVFQKHSLD
jgi:hypothetical protein